MAKRKRRRVRRRCFRGHIRYGLSGPGGVFSQEDQKSLQQPPIIRYRGQIVDKLPGEAKAAPPRPRRKVGKRRSTRIGRDASRSNDRLDSQPWWSGNSGFAYIRAVLPAPEPWHQHIPPWEAPRHRPIRLRALWTPTLNRVLGYRAYGPRNHRRSWMIRAFNTGPVPRLK
jgi:hypothetical protein